MLNAIQKGILTDSSKGRFDELEKQKEELSLNITVAELQKPKLTREYMECWFSQFQCGNQDSDEYRKRLIDTFVNSVYVYDDKLVLTYNYQQGMQTISLAEIEAFLGSDLTAVSPQKNLVLRNKIFYLSRQTWRIITPLGVYNNVSLMIYKAYALINF